MGILEWIIVVLLICWIGGLALNVAGGLIHVLLLIAILAIIYRLVTGRNL